MKKVILVFACLSLAIALPAQQPAYADVPEKTFAIPAQPNAADYQSIAQKYLQYADSLFGSKTSLSKETRKYIFVTSAFANTILEKYPAVVANVDSFRVLEKDRKLVSLAGYSEVMAFAKAKMMPHGNFNDNFTTQYDAQIGPLDQEGQDQLLSFASYYYTSYADASKEIAAEAGKNGKVKSEELFDVLGTYVYGIIKSQAFAAHQAYAQKLTLAKYDIQRDVRIPLRDGTKLSAILVLPKGASPKLPTILRVNCYPVNEGFEVNATKIAANKGYASLTVYNRGKYKSEGVFLPFENDAKDNHDIIDWISKQSWSDGQVGMYGGSYLGFAQWAATKYLHPALKTIVPQVAVGAGIDFPNPQGVQLTYNLQWLKYAASQPMTDLSQMRNQDRWDKINNAYLRNGVAYNKLDSLEGSGTDTIFQRWLKHPTTDDWYAAQTPTPEEFAKINIPIFTTTGYFDDDQRGAMYYYRMHNQFGPKDAINNHYLFIGPFDHGGAQGNPRAELAPYKIEKEALLNQVNLVYEWFDYVLKGKPKPAFLQDRVNVFVMGENRWAHFNSVQKMNRDTLNYYLSPNNQLQAKQANSSPIAIKFSTAPGLDDTLHIYTNNNAMVTEEIFKKKTKLLFETPVYQEAFVLNGSPTLDLYLSIDAPDADIFFTIWEEDAKGKLWPLSQSVQRLSHAKTIHQRNLLKTNEVYHFTFDNLYWITKRIEKGSKLKVTVAPLSDTFWQKNYGSGKDVSTETKADARNIELKIYNDAKRPSVVHFPVM
ncbi:hypothetical protein LX64_00673 [Chitinophaga skermanii]|uniref:Xaa-Pro dipeptidyl-peptidase C-terminal domain-containing protein n=1 Tax=Chitinophaga skermanii TaxID=331697 RepID=A0A327R2M0_9BACT|nr:CocE/NonD family hydrolase [Chitinophaga skermanii]RAJ11066.1 hypothetical protein LX64_00673 [Chitinophaga skermanii]